MVSTSLSSSEFGRTDPSVECFGKIACDLETRIKKATGDDTSDQAGQSVTGGASTGRPVTVHTVTGQPVVRRAVSNRGGIGG